MTSPVALPDIKTAVIDYLLAQPLVQAQSTKIGSVQRRSWGAEPGKMLLIRLAGSPGEENWYEVGFQLTRLDFSFYGATPEDATEFWRVVHSVLCPQQGTTKRHAFTIGGCRVNWIEKESGPFEVIVPVTELPTTLVSYVALWAGIPV